MWIRSIIHQFSLHYYTRERACVCVYLLRSKLNPCFKICFILYLSFSRPSNDNSQKEKRKKERRRKKLIGQMPPLRYFIWIGRISADRAIFFEQGRTGWIFGYRRLWGIALVLSWFPHSTTMDARPTKRYKENISQSKQKKKKN